MKTTGTRLGDSFKLTGNKVSRDEKAIEAKLDVSKRITRRKSQKIKVRAVQDYRP